ncbi:MAG: DUF3108 domain-containing protein [Elusimicrobiota bacterium]
MVFKLLLPLLLACSPALAGEALLSHPYRDLPPSSSFAPAAVAGMVNGETLDYDIYWGAVHVGRSRLKIEKMVDISSRPAWHIISETRSNSFLANFYKVDDRNESWMDAAGLHSYGYYKKISEGRHFFNEWVIFDNAGGWYYGKKMNRKRQASDFEGPLDGPVNDMLSAVYRLRAMRVAPGAKVELAVNTKRNWRLTIKAGKREKISTGYGKKKCILVEPMAGEEGLFVAKAGRRLLVWITDDELKVPMMLKAEISIGSITARLVRRSIKP